MKTSRSILLVEDDKDDQEFFILALQGIENATLYDVANNGMEALAKLQHAEVFPDLIFSDINMPLMNGMEYLTEMARSPIMKNIPVVMLTTDRFMVELAMKLGARACIEKPADEKTLRNRLEQMISLNCSETNLSNR